MFTTLYIIYWLSSVLFAFLTAIVAWALPAQLGSTQRRLPTRLTFIFGISMIIFGIYYLSYTAQIGDAWAIGALGGWLGALWLLWRSRHHLATKQYVLTKLALAPTAGFGSYLSIQRPSVSGIIVIFVFALAATGAAAGWHYARALSNPWMLVTRLAVSLASIGIIVIITIVHQQQSVLPPIISMNMPAADMRMMSGMPMRTVDDYAGPTTAAKVDHFDITASAQVVHLSSGATVQAWTFGDAAPTLHVTQGDLVEVSLTNHLSVPTTIHWHGIDLPNKEDGVAGITQDAVLPGASFTYRFIAKDAGTYWYHSHQDTSVQVPKGLFGIIVVDPPKPIDGYDQTIALHTWDTGSGQRLSFNTTDTLVHNAPIAPGTRVRLRIANTDSVEQTVQLLGVPFRVASLDGRDLTDPGLLNAQRIEIPAGSRVDLTFAMPHTSVQFATLSSSGPALVYGSDSASGRLAPQPQAPLFDMTQYGRPTVGTLTTSSHFDKSYVVNIDASIGFFDGQFLPIHTINDKLLPHTKMLMVHEGDTVKFTFRNRTVDDHPMHLHGHHFTVLSHNGQPDIGSNLQLDTLQVKPGDTWEVAFVADNPGIWMSHCHNLIHAAQGMDLMIGYDNVMTPYAFGSASPNRPE